LHYIIAMRAKYFIGLLPPANICEKVENIKLELLKEYKLRGALRSPAHITLHRPFEWREDREQELLELVGKFRPKKKFTITLKNFNCFQPRVIYIDVVENDELRDLYYLVRGHAKKQMGLFNEDDNERGFHAHVTVAFRDLKKQLFYKLWEQFEKREFAAEFEFKGLCLFKLQNKWEVLREFNI
jgi:2'-5' RNA ligase